MTRDEAIKILKDKIWPTFGSNEAASVWLDAFVELGMLKLEEPKSAREKFKTNLLNCGYNSSGLLEILICFDESQK